MHKVLILSAAVLALAGCNQPQAAGSGGGSGSAAAPATGGAPAKLDRPMRREGLWEQSMRFDGKVAPGMDKIRICVGPATNARISVFGERMEGARDCHKSTSHALDGSMVLAATCRTADGTTTTSNGTVSGDYSSRIVMHSESDTTGSPIPGRNRHSVVDITMTYLGACPADMADGDEIAGGMKINLVKMLDAADKMK